MISGHTKSFRVAAEDIPFEHNQKKKIFNTFFALSDYLKKYPNPGACHLFSSILHVLLKEQGIDNDLCIGEVETGSRWFDHSWIEIDGIVFDIAIQITLDESTNAPVYGGYDLATEKVPDRVYGAQSPVGFDAVAQQILKVSFTKYMDEYPHFRDGAWKIVKLVGKELRLKLDINELRQKYKDTKRILKR